MANRFRPVSERIARYATLPVDDMFRDLDVDDATGLTHAQVMDSQTRYGRNSLIGRRDTVWFRLRRAFVTPFTVTLAIIATISFVTDVLFPSNAARSGTMVAVMVVMLLIGGLVRFVQEMNAKRITDRLSHIVDVNVGTLRNGRWRPVPASDLAVGDIVRLRAGDRVPADIRLTRATDLFVSQSAITGESAMFDKHAEPIAPSPVPSQDHDRYTNCVFASSMVIGGTGEGVVLAVGADTSFGALDEAGRTHGSGFDRGANSIAAVLVRFIIVLAPIVFVLCGLAQGDWLSALLFALSVAVGLMPELLPMVVNACLSRGGALMRRKETVVTNVNAMQGFGSMDVLCVDKTGTLTGDKVTLEYYMDVLGNESRSTLDLAYLNSRYHTGVRNHLDDAILDCAGQPGQRELFDGCAARHAKLDELPFDYTRRLVSVLVSGASGGDMDGTDGTGITDGTAGNLLIVKGDVDEVCRRCRHVAYHGRTLPIGDDETSGDTGDESDNDTSGNTSGDTSAGRDAADAVSAAHAVVDELMDDGMKVIAVAVKPMGAATVCSEGDEDDLTLLGFLAFFDAPKPSAANALHSLKALHVDVKVLTGDSPDVTRSICRRIGMDTSRTLTGRELDALDDDELPIRVEGAAIFTGLSPRQKSRIVGILRDNGHTVGFLGDGMNDLPAIMAADVGISVDNAVQAVRESADVILLKKDLTVLRDGIEEGRKAFANMTKYIKITASSNFGNICSIAVASVLLPFLPMTSVQLLLLNLLYDIICLVLPWDPVDRDMVVRPREWSGRTLGRFMRFFGPISSVFDLLTFALLWFALCPVVCGGPFAALDAAGRTLFVATFQTGWFLESMWSQVLILYLLRTTHLPLVHSRPSRPVLAITALGIAVFTALTFTPVGGLLGLTAMPAQYFAALVGIVLLYLIVVTVAKARYVRRYHELL